MFQNLNLIQHHDPKLVIVFGADHVYRMDVRQMIAFHQQRRADITVAALPVPLDQASAFGIIATDADGRVREFQEKVVDRYNIIKPDTRIGYPDWLRPGSRSPVFSRIPIRHCGGAPERDSQDRACLFRGLI